MLIMRKNNYALDWSTCERQTNLTDQEDPAETDNDEIYFRAADIMYVLHSLLHWPEYAFLAYGTYKFIKDVQTWDACFITNVLRIMRRLFFGTMKTEKHTSKESKLRTQIAVLFVLVFIVASLVIPILSIVEAHTVKNLYPNCEKQNNQLRIHYVYQFLSILAHIVNPAIRIYMAVMVLAIQAIWFHVPCYEHNSEFKIAQSSDDAETLEDFRAASSKHCDCVIEYELRQDKIIAILHVFQAWFVIQWFIYYFQFLVDLSRIIRPWLKGAGLVLDLAYAHRVIYAIYDLFAFILPHVCGLKMNQHHANYLAYLRQQQLEVARDPTNKGTKLRHAIAYLLPIDKRSDCDFIPLIPGTGIRIPLGSPGYVLGIVLAIFTFAGRLVT